MGKNVVLTVRDPEEWEDPVGTLENGNLYALYELSGSTDTIVPPDEEINEALDALTTAAWNDMNELDDNYEQELTFQGGSFLVTFVLINFRGGWHEFIQALNWTRESVNNVLRAVWLELSHRRDDSGTFDFAEVSYQRTGPPTVDQSRWMGLIFEDNPGYY